MIKKKLILTGKDVIEDFIDRELVCPRCKSNYLIKIGYYSSIKYGSKIQRLKCKKCGKTFTGIPKIMELELKEEYIKKENKSKENWNLYTEAQKNEKEYLFNILDELFDNIKIIYNKKKGRRYYDIKDIIYCLVLKTYTKLSSRRLTTDIKDLKNKNRIKVIPDYTTLSRYLKKYELTQLLNELIRISSRPIREVDSIAVDSSGFSTSQFGRWFDYKWGEDKTIRNWIKAHISCDTVTNIITSVTITKGHFADSPQLRPLLKNIEPRSIKEVSADKAYLSKQNLQLITDLGATPYIKFKSNTTGKSRGSHIWKKSYLYFKNHRQEFLEHYHKRSNVETCFHMIKKKFGKELSTKCFESQKNELLLKILCHNICCLVQEYFTRNIELDYSTEIQKLCLIRNSN